jgi:iron complex outermembrane receptor protein
VTVKFAYDRTEDEAQPKGLTRLAANPLCPIFYGTTCDPLPDLFDTESGLAPLNGTDAEGYSMTLSWRINDNWTFKSISAYRESETRNNIDFDTTTHRIADAVVEYFDDQTSQEFQFIYDGGGRFNGVFGAYYFDGTAGGWVNTVFFGDTIFNVFSVTEGEVGTESTAVFGDGSYAINDRLSFNFGLRATEEDKTGDVFNGLATDDTFSTVPDPSADFVDTETFSSVSPRLGLDYKFTDDVMGYLTLSRGFKSGGYNVRAQSNFFPESALPFDDEQLTVAEVGLKSLLADRSLVLNAAMFWGDYTDIQVSTFTAYDADGDGVDDSFFGNFLNAGDATLKGLELEFDWKSKTATWFGLSGNISYLDADPDTFLDANGDTFVDTQVITNAPELTGSLNANFFVPVKSGLVTATVSYGYRDESVLTNEGGEDPLNPGQALLPLTQDSYSMWNARIGWLHTSGKWGVTINGKNLADEEYITNGYNLPVVGVFQGSYGMPRTVTATLEWRFL